MKRRVSIIWIAVLLGGGVILQASEPGDFEYWTQFIIAAPLSETWEFESEVELQFADNAKYLRTENLDVGLIYSGLASWVDIGVGFMREYEKDSDRVWQPENRPRLDVILKTEGQGMVLKNRSRMEYRNFRYESDYWRFRNVTMLELPVWSQGTELRPFVAIEPFVNIDQGGFKKLRSYVGLTSDWNKRMSAKLYYLYRSYEHDDQWDGFHVLGTMFIWHFK